MVPLVCASVLVCVCVCECKYISYNFFLKETASEKFEKFSPT